MTGVGRGERAGDMASGSESMDRIRGLHARIVPKCCPRIFFGPYFLFGLIKTNLIFH